MPQSPKSPKQHCNGKTRRGTPCQRRPIPGGRVCYLHGGHTRHIKSAAVVRHELTKWTLGQAVDDPGEIMLRLVTQSAARVQRYSEEVSRMVEAEPNLQRALIGNAYGEFGKQGEYVKGLVALENLERDRCANFCRIAIAAGIAERQVRLAERQGQLITELLRAVLADPALGLTPTQQGIVPSLVRRHLESVKAG